MSDALSFWEYHTVITYNVLGVEALNKLGSERWELVAVAQILVAVPGGLNVGQWDYIFKRRRIFGQQTVAESATAAEAQSPGLHSIRFPQNQG